MMMTQHTDFLNIYPKPTTPEPQLAAWLPEINQQIKTLEAAQKDYHRQVTDLEKIRADMMPGKVVEYALGGLLTAAESFMDEFLLQLATKKEILANLDKALLKLRSQQLAIRSAHDGYRVTHRNEELQAEKDAQQQAREHEEKQRQYERMRSMRAYEGDQDAIDNWPDTVEEYDVMMAARRRGAETQRRADQDARQAEQAAEAASLNERITAWFGKFGEE